MNVGSSVPVLKKLFSLSCLDDFLENIEWDSNVLDINWTPEEVTIPGETEPFTLRVGENFVEKAPFRFRKWLTKGIQPHKDPLAFLLFLLKRLRIDVVDYILKDFSFPLFCVITPR